MHCQRQGNKKMVGRLVMENDLLKKPCSGSTTIIRDHIRRIALEWPTYGYRTITAELGRHYKTAPVNHKRILRMMREDNLLCLRKRR